MKLEGGYDAIIDCKKIAQEIGESEPDIMVCFAMMLRPREEGRTNKVRFIVSKETHDIFKKAGSYLNENKT